MLFSSSKHALKFSTLNVFFRRNGSNIGFIGLGNMGKKMAGHLCKKGNNLKVYDISPTCKVEGAEFCKNAAETTKNSQIIITMLPNSSCVKSVLTGKDGIISLVPKGSLLIDCSTIEPMVAKELAQVANDAGLRFLDAPVSGGVTGAEAGTLSFMVGGKKKDVEEVEPILLQMGSKVYHCGEPGNGQIAKLCNNLILGITMIGTSEAMNLGISMGLDPKLLSNIVNTSTGRSWSSDTYSPVPGIFPNVPSSNDCNGGFSVSLVAKDLGLAQDLAATSSVPIPLGAVAHQLYRSLQTMGYGDKDFTVIYKFLRGFK